MAQSPVGSKTCSVDSITAKNKNHLLWSFLTVCGFVQVACQGFMVREACSVFWWVELYFFSLECNEVSSNEL